MGPLPTLHIRASNLTHDFQTYQYNHKTNFSIKTIQPTQVGSERTFSRIFNYKVFKINFTINTNYFLMMRISIHTFIANVKLNFARDF